VALAQIPGGTLSRILWVSMPRPAHPAGDPKAGTIVQKGGKNVDYYEIS